MKEEKMTGEDIKKFNKEEISRRIREGVKTVIEQVLEEEMTEHMICPNFWTTYNVRVFTYRYHF